MRKTSQDGGDSTSITSGIENEIKKPGAIMKTKRNSIKRKVQNFSLESDDAVIEPLLQKDKEKTDTAKQSAKFNLLSKNKTETNSEKRTDKNKLMSDDKLQKAVLSNASDVTDKILPTSSGKETLMSKSSANAPLHNHMNTNMFSNHDGLKTYVAPKSQILVDIDGSKHVGYNPSPLIFTTAKIHTDGKTKHMEPVQVTPVPILSTIEVSMKNGMNTGETSGHVTSNISAVYIPQSNKHVREQEPKPPNTTVSNTTTPQNKVADMKIQIINDKIDGKSNSIDKSSTASSSKKEIKLTQPNIAKNSIKDNFTGNKSQQNKTETQPSSSTSEKDKTIVPHEGKSVSGSIAFTKMANSSIKEAKKDKADNWHPENKINLNETVKPEVLDLQRTKPSDHVNSLDKTSQDKPKDSANTSCSSKQLQRQSIVLDKEDPIAKIKPNIVSPPITNGSRGLQRCGESQKPSTVETNTLSDKTKMPKSSADSIQITSVTSVSTDNDANKAADNKIYASTATSATLNKKPSPITSNIAINQSVASAINSAVTNNPTTTTSTVKNISAVTNKVAVTPTTSALITVADNKSSAPIKTPIIANKTSTTNIVASTIISGLSTTTTSNKTSSAVTSIATDNKLSLASTPANKISNPMTTSAATNKMSSPSTAVAISTKISSPATTASNKVSSPSSTKTASNKLCYPITTTSATSNIPAVTSTINAASNKISPSSPTTMTGYKITAPSSTTTADSKVSKPATTNITTAINKISAPSTTSVTSSKTSTTSSTTTAGSKVSPPSITSTASNKISSPSTAITAATKKLPNPVITTTAIKMTSGSTTTTTGVDKISTPNSNSSVPITSSPSTLPQSSNTSITKSAIITTPSASKSINKEHHSSNISKSTNIKSGIPNETFTTTTATAADTKPMSITTTTKPAKVTTVAVANSTTTSQHTTVVKSPTVTTAKSVETKTKPQLAAGKSTVNPPKSSSTSNEKPTTAKASTASTSSTTTSGVSNTTSTAAAVYSGSSPVTAEANKQSDSKSKVIGNGSKSFKA